MIRSRKQPTHPTFGCAAATRLGAFLADRSGGALLWFGLSVPVLLGAAGIGVDVTTAPRRRPPQRQRPRLRATITRSPPSTTSP